MMELWQDLPLVRPLLKRLSLEPPLPLRRLETAVIEEPLKDLACVVGGRGGHRTGLANFLEGQKCRVSFDFKGTTDAALFDASAIATPEDWGDLFSFVQKALAVVPPHSRVIIVTGNPSQIKNPISYGCQEGLKGFVRSLARETGRKAIAVHLVSAEDQDRVRSAMHGLLQFLLSARSAFLTGQVWNLNAAALPPSWEISPSLEGKSALVTGAAGGIGAETVQTLQRFGAEVVACDVPEAIARMKKLNPSIHMETLAVDISAAESPQKIAEAAAKRGGFDLVVHNAGITRDRTLRKMSQAEWDSVAAINFASICRMDEALLGGRLVNDEGRMIYLSSVSGIAGNFGQTNYATTKAALIGYVKAQACKLAADKITVNAIAPGLIKTAMTDKMPWFTREIAKRLAALGQAGLPRDVAETIAMLGSTQGAGLTGSVIRVCGGSFLGA